MRVCSDRQRGRGQMGAKSPLLWEEGQVESLLAGSPVVNMVKDRLKVRYCDVALVLVYSCTATALMSQPQGTDSPRGTAPGQRPQGNSPSAKPPRQQPKRQQPQCTAAAAAAAASLVDQPAFGR